jgi:hypothetical protein
MHDMHAPLFRAELQVPLADRQLGQLDIPTSLVGFNEMGRSIMYLAIEKYVK